MLYDKYISTRLLTAIPIFLCISPSHFVFLLPPPLRAKVPVLSTLSSRMLLCWVFVLMDLRLVNMHCNGGLQILDRLI